MKHRRDFCILKAGYTKSYNSEKLPKAVNNTPATEIWRLLTCQNCQMICKLYYWVKQHANISPLILMTDWLMAMHCSQKTTCHSWVILKMSQKRCLFWDVSEKSLRCLSQWRSGRDIRKSSYAGLDENC